MNADLRGWGEETHRVKRPALGISTNGFHSKITSRLRPVSPFSYVGQEAAKTGYLDGKMFYSAIPLFVLSA
jgi:hypothetical protein